MIINILNLWLFIETTSTQWYNWGSSHNQSRLCHSCWVYWKKCGGFKYPSRMDPEKIAASNPLRPDGTPNITTYPCRECNKVFNRQERLIAHMVAHRPHRCTITGCGKEFKFKAHLARHCSQAHGIQMRSGSPRPIVKTRAAFYLQTNVATKLARYVNATLFKARHTARKPFLPINSTQLKQECKNLLY